MRLHSSGECGRQTRCFDISIVKCTCISIAATEEGARDSQRVSEWEMERAWNFFFFFASTIIIIIFHFALCSMRRKIVYNISFASHTRHTNGIRPKYFGKIYFSFLQLRLLHHFSPFGIFGLCLFLRRLPRARAPHYWVCCNRNICTRVGGFRLATILRMWTLQQN